MIVRLIFAIACIIALCYTFNFSRKYLQKQPPEQKKQLLFKFGFISLIGILLLLIATGRIHWISAIFAALIPLAKYSLPLLFKLFPFISHVKKSRNQSGKTSNNSTSNQSNNGMNRKEALDILGLDEKATYEDIVAAHKKLMQKMHPDRDGSNYLAAKINEAKDYLTK